MSVEGHRVQPDRPTPEQVDAAMEDVNDPSEVFLTKSARILAAELVALRAERDERGPYFVRDMARVFGLPDSASMDEIHEAATRQARPEPGERMTAVREALRRGREFAERSEGPDTNPYPWSDALAEVERWEQRMDQHERSISEWVEHEAEYVAARAAAEQDAANWKASCARYLENRVAAEARAERADELETLIARQLTPLDVAATHIDILRRKGDEYTTQERDNVAAIVEQHVTEARHNLFAVLAAAVPAEDLGAAAATASEGGEASPLASRPSPRAVLDFDRGEVTGPEGFSTEGVRSSAEGVGGGPAEAETSKETP